MIPAYPIALARTVKPEWLEEHTHDRYPRLELIHAATTCLTLIRCAWCADPPDEVVEAASYVAAVDLAGLSPFGPAVTRRAPAIAELVITDEQLARLGVNERELERQLLEQLTEEDRYRARLGRLLGYLEDERAGRRRPAAEVDVDIEARIAEVTAAIAIRDRRLEDLRYWLGHR